MAADRDAFTTVLMGGPVPDEDRRLSPITGLTRDHWVATADRLLLSAARFRSPGGALLNLPGQPSLNGVRSDGLEGFARTFLLAAFRRAGSDDDAHGHLARYLDGLVAGPRRPGRDDDESWPVIGHHGRHGQPQVEAASIALGLHLTTAASWDQLATDQQDRLDGWLRTALSREPAPNNWHLFPLTVASFLEAVGRGDDQTTFVIDRGLGLLEQWYHGQGWYSDGDGAAFDHYVGWAMHFYPLLHATLRGDSALGAVLGERLEAFLRTFVHTFDRNGAPVYLGRSMSYRMAALAAVAMGEVTGHTPLRPGQSRRLMSACLRYFVDRGAVRDGLLGLGWHGPHPPTVQGYSGPGSPYWASKGFAALMLPPGHPVWIEPEESLDSEHADAVLSAAPAGLLIQRTGADGLVRVHNHGSDHLKTHEADAGAPDPLYARFAYSTRTGPTVVHNVPDNDVRVEVRDGWSVRRRIHQLPGGEGWASSWHAPRFPVFAPFIGGEGTTMGAVLPSARIESTVIARGRVEVRINRLIGIPPGSRVSLTGWAIAAACPDDLEHSAVHDAGSARAADGASGPPGEPGIQIGRRDRSLTSQLVGVHGWLDAERVIAPAGTAHGPWAMVPGLRGRATDDVYVAIASLTAEPLTGAPAEQLEDLRSMVDVTVGGTVVTVDWRDGTPTTTVDVHGALA